MKQLFTFIILVVISTSTFAQTEVSGDQTGTWAAANSPYNVIGDITVSAGEVLTIEAGVEVNFQGHYRLTVLGTLNAIGTEADSVCFTTDNQTTGWGGISLGQSIDGAVTSADGISNFTYCRFEYGKTEVSYDYPNQHGGAIKMIDSNAEFSNCIFADNDATGDDNGMGGAIYTVNTGSFDETLTFVTNCKFLRNTAKGEGGAIHFTSDLNTEITNCEFIDNSVQNGGGAIGCYGVVDTKIANCLFVNNSTYASSGGAIYTLGVALNTMLFTNCTMVGNEATNGDGGACALFTAEVDFVNCIIYDNEALYGGIEGDNVYTDAGSSSATINYSNIIMPEYNTTGANNIETDPLFVDAANGNYQLQESSPCVDAGTDVGLPYFGTAPDMGCYEYGLVSINNVNSENITIYPNPTNGNINLVGFENSVSNIRITDITGKLVKEFSANNNINISELRAGIYFLNIKDGNNNYTKRIIKE